MPPVIASLPRELNGGPQDGGRVHPVGGNLPQALYVGRQWQGDGFAAWGYAPCERFPCCYLYDGLRYHFVGWCY